MSFSKNAKLPLYEVFNKPKKVADVGIELEIEGMALPSVPHWQAKSEGSLHAGGIEYITKPIKAEVVKTYVDNLRQSIQSQGGVIKPSYRCSTHIHHNMLCDNVEDILGFAVIFTIFEPVLLSLCGPQRDGNLFCLSTYDTGDIIESFDRLCRTLDTVRERGFGYERGKYSALNLGRLADLGTVELRCYPLSVDGATVSTWVQWGMAMKDMAKAEPDKTYRSLWKNVRQNPQWYAMKIFGAHVHTIPNLSSLVDMGSETAYELTKILKTWYAKPEKKSEGKLAGKKATGYIIDDLLPSSEVEF